MNFPLTHQSIPHVQANQIIRLYTVATKNMATPAVRFRCSRQEHLSMIFNTSSSFYCMHIIPNHSRASPFGVNSFWNLWNLCQYVETNRKHSNIKIADSSDCYCYARQVSAYCIVYNGDCTQTLALHSTSSLSCLLLQNSRVFRSFQHIGTDSTDSRSN